MSDIQQVKTSSGTIITGSGILNGIVASVTAADTPGDADRLRQHRRQRDGHLPGGGVFRAGALVLFFPDRFAPRFNTGLYLALDADLAVVVWASQR